MKDERVYLLHAIEAIDAILSYTADGSEAFFSDGKTQDAVIRNIEIIGQAVKGISDETRALEPAVPWWQIAGMRDKLIHEYPVASANACMAGSTSSMAFATGTTSSVMIGMMTRHCLG